MKIAVCEDEQVYSELISGKTESFFGDRGETAKIDLYTDGGPLLDALCGGKNYDLILLDLQLENSDGMEVAAKIRERDQSVSLIFVTGMENRAAEGYSVDALDYVVKTQLDQRLEAALERFLKKSKENALVLDLSEGETAILPYSDILWVESENRGVKVVTAEKEYSSSLPVGKITCRLPAKDYIEIHKSVYVRIRAIKRIGADQVVMSNDVSLPLSRRRRKEVMKSVLEAVKGRTE